MKDPTENTGLNTLMTLSKSILSVDVRTTTSLDLTSCCLTYIPSVLKDLPLRNLKLSKNKLKEIPECLYLGLEKLEYLDLCHNQIKTFEVEPKCCETLKMLNISYNKMADIPQWILCLYATNLEELCYDFNRVTCLRCIFDNPEKFPVKKLSMKNCILRKEDCNFLKQCKNLEQLNISNSTESTLHSNIIENVEQLFIQPNWKNINILKLNNIAISIFPENLTWLETLTELHLTHNDFMWLPIDGLEFLVNLEVLDLSHNSLYSIPDKLCWLENLKVLKLNFNNIESIPDFSKMERLEILDLYYNKLLNFEYNMDTKNLKYLDLEFNYFNTEDYGLVSYEHKRDEFRRILQNEKRFIGHREMYDCFQSSDSDSICKYSDQSDILEENKSFVSLPSEDWDEEYKLNTKSQDVSPSDDEWRGSEENITSKKIRQLLPPKSILTYNEDVIFCDAD